MLFFADTANLKDIKEIAQLGVLDGVTTNPSLMAKEGIKGNDAVLQHYRDIAALTEGDISAEVISVDYDGMVKEGRILAELADNIVVKIPMIKEGMRAISTLADEGIRTNCTLIFTPGQALMAAKAGASYVSPFMGRLDDLAQEGIDLIAKITHILDNYDYECMVLAASIRSTLHITQCAEIGAHVVTCPPSIILQLLNHPLTDLGLAKFLDDHKKLNS
ncbi:MAG: fructose-6-phosphate aldolase [Bacteroidota bacterium]|nr:fructose-6-phosphate aldolase [Bacteroidota bacterium]